MDSNFFFSGLEELAVCKVDPTSHETFVLSILLNRWTYETRNSSLVRERGENRITNE